MRNGLLSFRAAQRQDIQCIVEMLADDELGATRECPEPLPDSYFQAFEAIHRDPNNELIVATLDDQVVGVLQLTFVPSISFQGSWRGMVESVRVASDHRGQGLGKAMFQWAIERARSRGCRMLQLTTDKSRKDAIRFYRGLGFVDSHEGMKLHLAES